MFDPVELVKRHLEFKQKYAEILTLEERKIALKDPHSKRPPRYCGMTIHFTIGCPFQCSYCYIYDMGFPKNPKPYPLTPKQLVYALLNNPNFIAGRFGTLLAIGAVSEPFIFREKAIKFLRELAVLKNPIQFSTKSIITRTFANELAKLGTSISPLISIITLEHKDLLEPYAPSVDSRLDSIKNLANRGFKVCVFIRPIIVGINDREVKDIMLLAKENGAKCVIIGSFRITYSIYQRLRSLGFNMSEIEKRINPQRLKKQPKKQFTIPISKKQKEQYLAFARKIGLIPFKSACCANSYAAGVICPSICFETGYCTYCPNRCWEKPRPDLNRVKLALSLLELNISIKEESGKLRIDKKRYRWLVQVLSRRLTY